MGEINHGLNGPLKFHLPDFIQKQSHNNRNHYTHDNFQNCDVKGIPYNLVNIRQMKHILKIFKPHPFRMEEAFAGIKFLKGHNSPGQGNIVIRCRDPFLKNFFVFLDFFMTSPLIKDGGENLLRFFSFLNSALHASHSLPV